MDLASRSHVQSLPLLHHLNQLIEVFQDWVCRERSLEATPLSLGGAGEMLGGGTTHLKPCTWF